MKKALFNALQSSYNAVINYLPSPSFVSFYFYFYFRNNSIKVKRGDKERKRLELSREYFASATSQLIINKGCREDNH